MNRNNGARPTPALNPEGPMLVQPWKEFVSKGFVSSLTVSFKPMGTEIKAILSAQHFPNNQEELAPGAAKDLIVKAGLWSPKGNKDPSKKVSNLPKRSLVVEDFEGEKDKFAGRVGDVSKNLGDTTAAGRIGSLRLMRDGVTNFEQWWKMSTDAEKIRILSDGKHFNAIKEKYSGSPSLLKEYLATVPHSPFRGSVPTENQEEQKTAKEEKKRPVSPPKEGEAAAKK